MARSGEIYSKQISRLRFAALEMTHTSALIIYNWYNQPKRMDMQMNKKSEIKSPVKRRAKYLAPQFIAGLPVHYSYTFLFAFYFFVFLAGCAERQKIATEPILTPVVDKTKAMEIAEDVLADMHFAIEKADPQSGYIRTRPLAGAQFFEIWRSDNVGAKNWLLGNLHSIRRTVEIDINQQFGPELTAEEQAGELHISCDVQIQKLSLPERQITSSARAYAMFSRSSPALQTLRINPEQEKGMAWIDLDKDTELENEILKRIEKRIHHVD